MTNIINYIDVITLSAILAGVIFGYAEVRRAKISRRDEAAMHIFESPLFDNHIDALFQILNLPEDASHDLIYADEKLARHALMIWTQMESWGTQVFHKKIDLHTLDIMVGGTVRLTWNRLRNYIFAERKKFKIENTGEWFQWLAERLDQYPSPEKGLGAQTAFKDWKP